MLPLALELAFEPKDPQRVLELLTLPVGPFRGTASRRLAAALTQSPGIGGPGGAGANLGIRSASGTPLDVPVRAWILESDADCEGEPESSEPRYWFAQSPEPTAAVPGYHIAPSSAATESLAFGQLRVASTTRFTTRMPFNSARGTNWDHVGTTLHAFLAADHPQLKAAERAGLALSILNRAELDASFTPQALLGASDALRAFVASRWPTATWHREIPIQAALNSEHGPRRISGSIDLLLETPEGFVIIDHKSFPGSAAHWAARALEYAPQLMTYAKAIEMAGGTVIGRFIHFTVGGGMAELVEHHGDSKIVSAP